MIVDGEPEFPVGLYVAIRPKSLSSFTPGHFWPKGPLASLDELQDSPFDVLVNYGSPEGTPEERRRYFDELHKRGLREMFSLKDYYLKGAWGTSPYLDGRTEEEAIRQEVQALKDHPALLGWYICDEEKGKGVETVEQHHKWVKEEDPLHPTLAVYRWTEIASGTVGETADILGTDPYPIPKPKEHITYVGSYTDQLLKTTKGRRPAWLVLQAFGFYLYELPEVRNKGVRVSAKVLKGKSRAPTPREMRCMTYLALTHGATGILYYYHKDIELLFDSEVRWRVLKSIGQEVRDLAPILLAPDFAAGKITGDNPNVHWRAKDKDGKLVVIAVNSSEKVESIVLDLPAAASEASFHAGLGMAYPHEKELLLILDGYEGVVVELE